MKRLDDHSWFNVDSSLGNSNSDKAYTALPLPPRYKMAIVMTGVIFCPSKHSGPGDTPANNWPSKLVKHTCRCRHNGSAYDLCDNAPSHKTLETLAD